MLFIACFQGDDNLTKRLLDRLLTRRRIYMVAGSYKDTFILRFVVCSRLCLDEDIAFSWNEIRNQATEILQEELCERKLDASKSPDEIAARIEKFNLKEASHKIP